jgi:hypothetical protein
MVFGACRWVFESGWAQAQYCQIDISIMSGKIGFEWFSAHAEGSLKAVGRKPSGVGSSVGFHARTLRKPVDIRLTGQLALLRFHLPISKKCNFINVAI